MVLNGWKEWQRVVRSSDPPGENVLQTPVERGILPSLSSLQGAKTGPLSARWKHEKVQTRLKVTFSGGQMDAARQRRSPKWKFRHKLVDPTATFKEVSQTESHQLDCSRAGLH